MIPLGVLASGYVAPAGGGGALTVVQFASAKATSVTLAAAPTAGNLLVAAIRDVGAGAYTYSHSLTVDRNDNVAGWNLQFASGTVESGDPATLSVTGMNATFAAIGLWEIANWETGFVEYVTVKDNWITEVTLAAISGATFAAIAIHKSHKPTFSGVSISNGDVDGITTGAIFGSTHLADSSNTAAWTQSPASNELIAIKAVYA